jgi:hypothetical protein
MIRCSKITQTMVRCKARIEGRNWPGAEGREHEKKGAAATQPGYFVMPRSLVRMNWQSTRATCRGLTALPILPYQ